MTVELTNGMFRGICVDNRDPKNLGRIRVQVPQILGTAASGWAFPSWTVYQKTIWPQDRLPKAGDGVWVMFDSTSPDKMIWMAAFGPLDLINQPEYVAVPDFKSALTMTVGTTPVWNQVCRFEGYLTSDAGGTPNPNATIQLTGRIAGGNWQTLATDTVASDGKWEIDHTIVLTGSVEYRATFPGVGVYGPASSEIKAFTTATVTFPTSLSLAMPDPAPALNKKVVLQGSLLTGGTPPTGYEVPGPNAEVNVVARPGTSGPWQSAVVGAKVDEGSGAWSSEYTITIPGSVQYQATYAGTATFLASNSTVLTVNTSVATTVSAPVLPTLTRGSAFSTSGTVKVAGTGANVTEGTVKLWVGYTVGADQTWYDTGVSATITNGSYSLTHPSITYTPGATKWQVRYGGTNNFNASTSADTLATIGLATMGALTKGAVSHTSAAFSWAAISGATAYSVEKWNGSAWAVAATTTGLSHSDTGLSYDGTYYWRVRARATDPAGSYVYGGYAAQIQMSTGHPKVQTTGSTGWVNVAITYDDSWRNDGQDWGATSTMMQGYYSSAYGGEGYTGAAIYGGTKVRDAIIAACGTSGSTKHANGTCTACEIQMTRLDDVGNWSSTVSTNFYRSNTMGSSGGKPDRSGTAVARTLQPVSAGATWYDVGTAHGQVLGDAGCNSIVIYKNTSADYAAFHAYDIRLKWSWDYTSTALVSAAWA